MIHNFLRDFLSKNIETAIKIGQCHGKPVALKILAREIDKDGYQSFESKNNAWLTDCISVKYLTTNN